MKALVCEQWELNFEDLQYKDSKGANRSYIEVSVKDEKIAAECVLANTMLLDSILPDLTSGLDVLELYGGAGFHTISVQNLLEPANHTVIELDDSCVAHLRREFPNVKVIQGKAENNCNIKADYYSLDSNSWTINTLVTNKDKNKDMYDAIFGFAPMAIQVWDSSKPYFASNKGLYSGQLGQEISTPKDYAKALSDYFYKNYGYSFSRVCYLSRSTYFMLQPAKHDMVEIDIAKAGPVKGFRWIS